MLQVFLIKLLNYTYVVAWLLSYLLIDFETGQTTAAMFCR